MKKIKCPQCKGEVHYLHARISKGIGKYRKYTWRASNAVICLNCEKIFQIRTNLEEVV